MPKKLSISHQDELRAGISKYLSTNEEARFVRRMDVLLLLCNGQSIEFASQVYCVSSVTVQRWVHRFNEEGIVGLRDRPKTGCPNRLTEEQKDKVKKELLNSPKTLGYMHGRWDGKLLSFHLKQKYNVSYKVRRCQLLFHELGFSLQRPRKVPVGGDPEQREAFKKKLREEILTDESLEVMFYDEAFFKRESTITRGWYLRGIKHSIPCQVTKDKVGVSGAINHRDGLVYSLIFDGYDSNTFICYLESLLEYYRGDRKIALILDNASSHKSKLVKGFVETINDKLELIYLPPYSPDLNPVEGVWKDLRYKVTHNVYFESKEDLENRIIDYLKERSVSSSQR